jgi:hypothetical protein
MTAKVDGPRAGLGKQPTHRSSTGGDHPGSYPLPAHTGTQLLRLTLERKRLIIRQLVRNAGKMSWENARAGGRHQPL